MEELRATSQIDQPATPALALTALGIVYGDLGTSPLYTLQTVAQTFDGAFSAKAAFGSLSLIIWILIITISIKYCLFVMPLPRHTMLMVHPSLALRHLGLDHDCAFDRIHHAGKFGENAVAEALRRAMLAFIDDTSAQRIPCLLGAVCCSGRRRGAVNSP